MTDREKIVNLIYEAKFKHLISLTGKDMGTVADYLLANGVIVPPCKVGDKVYWINHVTKEIETDIVIAIHQYENGLSIATDTIGTKGTTTFSLNRFLEIMHFTKEEAEEKLKELKNGI